ncbi:Adenylate isopentenyltransferase 1-chloroplastic [Striga hermonthica]|uniref:Adenylate isopentenyltransferase 1-chloroplastic n=1 Tax=Striga hermonthica TaxID=68872 RepID=A0A9N7MJH2_STRHE|nr:Adenylate isopentenyltransferase 1-chloroplastic [Striga hermonthica]
MNRLHSLLTKPASKLAAAAMSTAAAAASSGCREKLVVILGPTGCGKTKLSIDLASRFFPSSEIINSDKIQVYRGLDITTNKVPLRERKNVRHHLLGRFESSESHPDFTPSDFRSSASRIISEMTSRSQLPFLAGGSNSFVYSLLAEKYNPDSDVFAESDPVFCNELRYDCCFIWVDVSPPVLDQYLAKRVDDMLDSGMFDELSEYFKDLGPGRRVSKCGVNKAIGVPEFERYFRGEISYEAAVAEIKENTWQLAKRQVEKIRRLREGLGWEMQRVDTTAVLRATLDGAPAPEVWEKEVVEPTATIVRNFLRE